MEAYYISGGIQSTHPSFLSPPLSPPLISALSSLFARGRRLAEISTDQLGRGPALQKEVGELGGIWRAYKWSRGAVEVMKGGERREQRVGQKIGVDDGWRTGRSKWRRGRCDICISTQHPTAACRLANLANKSAASWLVSWSPLGSVP